MLKSLTTSGFWKQYHDLPEAVQKLADRGYTIWSRDPRHPSLRFKPFKKINGRYVSVIVTALLAAS